MACALPPPAETAPVSGSTHAARGNLPLATGIISDKGNEDILIRPSEAPIRILQWSQEAYDYFQRAGIKDVYECLLTAVVVQQPGDPVAFLAERAKKLAQLLVECDGDVTAVAWDSLIPAHIRPKRRLLSNQFLFETCGGRDHSRRKRGAHEPTAEMMTKALTFRNQRLRHRGMEAWKDFIRQRHYEKQLRDSLGVVAAKHYTTHVKQRVVRYWIHYRQLMHDRERGLQQICKTMLAYAAKQMLRSIFMSWLNYSQASNARLQAMRKLRGHETGSTVLLTRAVALPQLLLLKIFRLLSVRDVLNCSRVCRQWHMTSCHSTLWSRLDFSKYKRGITNDVLSFVSRKYRGYIVGLNLRGCRHITDYGMHLISLSRNLQDINLSGCERVSDAGIAALVRYCTALLEVNLSYTRIGDAGLNALSTHCPNLEYLSLGSCQFITDAGIESFVANGRRLHWRLRWLDISDCEALTDRAIKAVARTCHNLNCLVMSDLKRITTVGMVAVGVHCRHLRWVDVSGSPNIGDTFLETLARQRTPLTRLDLENNCVTDSGMAYLTHGCRRLTHLNANDCELLTDASLRRIGQHLKRVEVLSIADNPQFTCYGICSLFSGSLVNHVRKVNLTNCFGLGDEGLSLLFAKGVNLEKVELRFCDITDEGLASLHMAKALVHIDLAGCKSISDAGLELLGAHRRLQIVNLTGNSRITDNGIADLVPTSSSIECVVLDSCEQLTSKCIETMVYASNRIQLISLRECAKITRESLSKVQHRRVIVEIGCSPKSLAAETIRSTSA